MRVLCGFTAAYHNKTAIAVPEWLQGLFYHDVLLVVTREHSARACEAPGAAARVRRLCADGFVHTRYTAAMPYTVREHSKHSMGLLMCC